MTKEEKNAIKEIISALSQMTGKEEVDVQQSTNDNSTALEPSDDKPNEEEIEFVKSVAKDLPLRLMGNVISVKEGCPRRYMLADIKISSKCLSHLVEAYLEKYCHD